MLKSRVGIIIVGYNSRKYLPDCLGSVFDSSCQDFKVYFVDNKSSDDSLEYIEKKWTGVETIKLEQNYGFANANNIGAEKAMHDGCEYIFLLNPDTIVNENCLDLLIKSAKRNLILQPLILLHENGKKTDLINTSGNVLHYLGMSYVGNYRKNYKEIGLPEDIALASGAAMFIPAKIVRQLGLFDKSFFMYHEDVDFSWRARIAGFKINLQPDAQVWHKYSFSRNKNKLFYAERNRIIFMLKNFSTGYLLVILPIAVLNELLVVIYSIVSGWFLIKMKSYIDVIHWFNKIIEWRKIIEERKVSERELKQYLSSVISFSELSASGFRIYSLFLTAYWKLIVWVV
ncbi:MAG: glycosyltransferase family 2 protein [bacterium]|nr:glycosyltransferase family 2 protein [bacterium]